MPGSAEDYANASMLGPHANGYLFSQQLVITPESLQINYHEYEPTNSGYLDLLFFYFWHLRVHSSSFKWWIEKSGLKIELSKDQLSFLSDCKRQMQRHEDDLKQLRKTRDIILADKKRNKKKI